MPDHALAEQLNRIVEAVLAGAGPGAGGDLEPGPLADIAMALRDLPSNDFRQRLKTELQRRAAMMPSPSTVSGVPVTFRTITPFIIHAQAPGLVDFVQAVFGAEELKRKAGGDVFYSELRIGESVLMIGGGAAASRGNLPSVLHVYVDDCDAAYRRALDAGAVTLMGQMGEPADRPYGERSAFVQDAFGNYWYIATRLGSDPAPESGGSVLPHVHPEHARRYLDFLKRAFEAEELVVVEHAGRVMHAKARIGDAVLEMGEAADRTDIPLNGLFLFVDDVEAAYARAVEAGATSIRPPQDTPYGLLSAIVRDPEGYFWWPARWLAG